MRGIIISICFLLLAGWQFLSAQGTELWNRTGSVLSPVTLSNVVGIGTATPKSQLHVQGNAIQVSGGSLPKGNKAGLVAGENAGGFTWIQSKTSLPLALNAAANDMVTIGFIPGSINIPYPVKLAVTGKVLCDEIKVKATANWPDYVFDKSYPLPSLQETDAFIHAHHHLPAVPAAAHVVTNGLDAGTIQTLLLQKVEELTLYLIRQEKDIERLKAENKQLKFTIE